jgi:hypothetical protein
LIFELRLLEMKLQNIYLFVHKIGGCNIPGESDRWDFGVGAGFYIDATEPNWATNFKMYSYINSEVKNIKKLVLLNFHCQSSIFNFDILFFFQKI